MNWLNRRWPYYALSLLVLVLSLSSFLRGAAPLSVEFSGGSELLLSLKASESAQLLGQVQTITTNTLNTSPEVARTDKGEYRLSLPAISNQEKEKLVTRLAEQGLEPKEVSFRSVGPSVGRDLILKTGAAVLLAVLSILLYVGWTFSHWRFGLTAVLAMLHDTLILVGMYGWLGHFLGAEIDVLFVTAVLTTLSFSVHDTIVVFDRWQELARSASGQSPLTLANMSITQTLSRSLNNSITILIMLSALLIFGGDTTRWFVAALFIGTIVGTYSSTFVAMPLAIDLEFWRQSRLGKVAKK